MVTLVSPDTINFGVFETKQTKYSKSKVNLILLNSTWFLKLII